MFWFFSNDLPDFLNIFKSFNKFKDKMSCADIVLAADILEGEKL